MNEKSNPMPMMYKTIPAVAELNKVPGFDPLKFLRHKVPCQRDAGEPLEEKSFFGPRCISGRRGG